MSKLIANVVLVSVFLVAFGAVYSIGISSSTPTGLAITDDVVRDRLGSCCCEGPQGVFKVTSGVLESQTGFGTCSLVCSRQGSDTTIITSKGVCAP